MTYKEHYNDFKNYQSDVFRHSNIGSIEGTNAFEDLNKSDTSEVFRIDGYFEGVHTFRSECELKVISIGFSDTAGVNLFEYMTVNDLLEIPERSYLSISLYELRPWSDFEE